MIKRRRDGEIELQRNRETNTLRERQKGIRMKVETERQKNKDRYREIVKNQIAHKMVLLFLKLFNNTSN